MTAPAWKQVEGFPLLQWAETHEPGTVLVRDTRDCASEELVTGTAKFASWVANHSKSDAYLPMGDWIAAVTKRLGFKECEPCAKRRALLNSLMPRPR